MLFMQAMASLSDPFEPFIASAAVLRPHSWRICLVIARSVETLTIRSTPLQHRESTPFYLYI